MRLKNQKIRKEEFMKFLKLCEKKYRNSNIRLAAEDWDSAFKVLICTILSAQNKDTNTIVVCEKLFSKFDTAKKLSKASFEDVFKFTKSTNYNLTKTKNIIETSKTLCDVFNEEVPKNIDDLLLLRGVGRKTANLVLYECYKIPAICVDTHVHRICNLFEFVKTKNREDTEFELQKICDKKYWGKINSYLVRLGQEVSGYDKNKFIEKIKNF